MNYKQEYSKHKKLYTVLLKEGGHLEWGYTPKGNYDIYKKGTKKVLTEDGYKPDYMHALTYFINFVLPSIELDGNYIGPEAYINLYALNAGSFGLGCEVTDDAGREYVFKFVHPKILNDKIIDNEHTALSKLATGDNKYIIKYYGKIVMGNSKLEFTNNVKFDKIFVENFKYLNDPQHFTGRVVCFIFEKASYTLSAKRKSPIHDGRRFLFKLTLLIRGFMLGVNYIHTKGYVHLDIKPDNLMIKKDKGVTLIHGADKTNNEIFTSLEKMYVPKIIDMGLSTKYGSNILPRYETQYQSSNINVSAIAYNMGGTPYYMAYEHRYNDSPSNLSDTWACMLSICGHLDLIDLSDKSLIDNIREGKNGEYTVYTRIFNKIKTDYFKNLQIDNILLKYCQILARIIEGCLYRSTSSRFSSYQTVSMIEDLIDNHFSKEILPTNDNTNDLDILLNKIKDTNKK